VPWVFVGAWIAYGAALQRSVRGNRPWVVLVLTLAAALLAGLVAANAAVRLRRIHVTAAVAGNLVAMLTRRPQLLSDDLGRFSAAAGDVRRQGRLHLVPVDRAAARAGRMAPWGHPLGHGLLDDRRPGRAATARADRPDAEHALRAAGPALLLVTIPGAIALATKRQRHTGLPRILYAAAAVLLVANLVNKQAFFNQYWLVAALVVIALAATPERGPEPDTERDWESAVPGAV